MKRSFIAAAACLLFAAPALAQLHSGDILLTVSNNKIYTGAVDSNGQPVPGLRVFRATFGDLGPNATNNPGLDSATGVFQPGSSNGFRIMKALRLWDGTDFHTIPPEQIGITLSIFPPLGPVFTPMTDMVVEGFTIQVLAAGDWHHHLEYNLTAPQEAGIYLLELTVFSTVPSLQPTDSYWLVINKSSPTATHDAAFAYAQYVFGRVGCPADWNRDHLIDPSDVAAFVNEWFTDLTSGGLLADVNGDGAITPADVAQYVNLWFTSLTTGC